jgi:hypothetical protein
MFYGVSLSYSDADIYPVIINYYIILSRVYEATIYKTGIGLTTGFIGSHIVTHNYSVYTLTAPYSSLQHLPSLHTVSSLVSCLPLSQDPFACNSATLL